MKYFLIAIAVLLLGCQAQTTTTKNGNITSIVNDDYELIKSENTNSLLILFPGGGTTSKETKQEFKVVEKATSKGHSVLLMNFNRHLWIDDNDSKQLAGIITKVINDNKLNSDNITIGGMSIGGTVALTLSDYLAEYHKNIKPKGVFVVDSPIDLYALYESSQKDLARTDYSDERLAEPKFIVSYFEDEFSSDSLLSNIQKVSPFTLKTQNLTNIQNLADTKLRFYTEPDTLWIKTNRDTDFESTNAYTLQKTYEVLRDNNWRKAELIETQNKGYRANGERNPHSWSIVDVDELLKWVKTED